MPESPAELLKIGGRDIAQSLGVCGGGAERMGRPKRDLADRGAGEPMAGPVDHADAEE